VNALQALMLVLGVLLILAGVIALSVWIVRTLLRIVALRAAVRFLSVEGTNGSVIILADGMFGFLIRGKPVKR
jgi:hypothetical protein